MTRLRHHTLNPKHHNVRSNFSILRDALERCPHNSAALSGRDVGRVRSALAATIARRGRPDSPRHAEVRAMQAGLLALPTRRQIARELVDRLSRLAADGGIADPSELLAPAQPWSGQPVAVPSSLVRKVQRALDAPIEVLVEHQVRIDELPWVAALKTFRTNEPESRWSSRQTLTQTTMLTLRSFPQTMLPNPMVREIAALAKNAELTVPLVDEVAADIFMGTFTAKWRDSAAVTSAFLTDSRYSRYYDLPPPAIFASPQPARLLARLRGGTEIAEDFAALCKERAKEAARARPASGWKLCSKAAASTSPDESVTADDSLVGRWAPTGCPPTHRIRTPADKTSPHHDTSLPH